MTHNPRPLQALIVENDASGRELLARVLRLHGFEADTTIGTQAARRLLADPHRRYDLLVTDLQMEPLDGLELLRDVAAIEPARRPRQIVVLSGFIEDYAAKLGELRLEVEAFQKPIHLPMLVKLLEKLRV
jgi:CheY-like chemotaxis protein